MAHRPRHDHRRRGGGRAAVLALIVVLAAPPAAVAQLPPCDLETTFPRPIHPLPPGTRDVTGLAASARHPGWGWMVRGGSHPASLYAVRFRGAEGHLLREFPVRGARNRGWEEIVHATNPDGTGRLYVVEDGRSNRARHIYKIPEPDPERPAPVTRFRRYAYAYPSDRSPGTKAAFFYQGRLTLVTETDPARVYRFEDRLSEQRVNRPRFVGELTGSARVSVTRVAPDGRALITADHNRLRIYRAGREDADLHQFVGRRPSHQAKVTGEGGDHVEAGDFFPAGHCDLMLVAQSRNVYRVLTHGEPRP